MAEEQTEPARKKPPAGRKRPTQTRKDTAGTTDSVDDSTSAEVESIDTDVSDTTGNDVMTISSTDVASLESNEDKEVEPTPARALTIDERNRLQIGELIIHAPSRDIAIILDGASATRMMSVFAGTGSRQRLQDLMLPGQSDMRNLWSSIDLAAVIGLSWMPGLPSRSDHVMTVDPPPPES